jgi:hypothetical protein
MATYYAINAGGNFSAGGTWSTTATKDASRTGGATAPTNADTCILDDYSGAVTVDHATACLCKILDCTSNGNYASTLTFTAAKVLFVSGNVIFSAAMTIAGTGTLTINAACALTPGVTFTGSVSLAGTTVTLGANWTITGSLTSTSGTNVMNGNTCYIGGSLTAMVALSGTTLLVMNGTGAIGSASSGISISNSLTINTTGTISPDGFGYSTGIFTYISGTISGEGLIFINGDFSCNTSGMYFQKVYWRTSSTITLLSDFKTAFLYGYSMAVKFSGPHDVYATNLCIPISGNGGSIACTFPSGQTLYVSGFMEIYGPKTPSFLSNYLTIKASTATSAFYLNYSGPSSTSFVYNTFFTDVDASGSAQEIKNYNGGLLTRCTNIRNVNLPVIPSSVSIGG